jgi:hypothetical protein
MSRTRTTEVPSVTALEVSVSAARSNVFAEQPGWVGTHSPTHHLNQTAFRLTVYLKSSHCVKQWFVVTEKWGIIFLQLAFPHLSLFDR